LKYRNVIFDVGSVLLDYRWEDMLRDYGLDKEDALRVGHEMFDDPEGLWQQMDLGIRSIEDIIAAYAQHYPKDAEVIRWFIEHGEYMHVPRPKVWKMVHQLKEKGYHIYLLSNYPEGLFHKHTQYADFMKDLDGKMVSYMIHEAKPSVAIYQALCERNHLTPSECIFFDDRKENVEAAIRFGMASKQVLSQEGLLEDLQMLL
jgi:putative hydrolase of the HAD superfamily